jgi:hypothetical protein
MCDIHVSSNICKTGSEAVGEKVEAGLYCPSAGIEKIIQTRREVPYNPEPGDPYPTDWEYEYKALRKCPYHTEDGVASEFNSENTDETGETTEDRDVNSDGTGDGPGGADNGIGTEQNDGRGGDTGDRGGTETPRPLRTPRSARTPNPTPPRTPRPSQTQDAEGDDTGTE